MASLKVIRRRISSVKNTQQVTKAMKMVAAAKLRRAQAAAENGRTYSEKLTGILASLSSVASEDAHPFLKPGADAPAHVILLTSDRGLCGGYNGNLIRDLTEFLGSEEGQGAKLTICGRRGHDHFKKRDYEISDHHVNLVGGLDLELARGVGQSAAERFLAGEAGKVYVAYTKFRSAVSQEPAIEQLLPVAADAGDEEEAAMPDYVYEPNAAAILGSLLPRYVETKVFHAMLEATASEHGARMTAMDNATRNAGEMIDKLTLEMNRARQAGITTELMEIVGGAEALKG